METFELKLNRQQVQIIVDSLAEVPFKVSDPVIREVVRQVNEQMSQAEPQKSE